jgi:hypothetical protein
MRFPQFIIAALVTAIVFAPALADNDKAENAKNDRKASAKTKPNQPTRTKPTQITPAKEKAALEFVSKHQSELSELLDHLKKSGSKEYDRAIRDVLRNAERLSGLRKRDAARYKLELKAWRIKTQVQLLATRLSMTKDSKLESKLKAALAEHFELQLQIARQNREQLKQRLDKLDSQIERLEKSRQHSIKRQYETLVGIGEKAPKKSPLKKKTTPTSTGGDGNNN